jgi:hypothetical protein
MQKTLFILAVFVAAVLAGLFVMMSSTPSGPNSKETFMQKQTGAPVNGQGMGPYDNVSLPGVAAGWLTTENVPKGSAPLDTSAHPMLLMNNPKSPSCCGKTPMSTDSGCICLSKADEKLFESRGGNRALA